MEGNGNFLAHACPFSDFCGKNAPVETGESDIPLSDEVDDFFRFDVLSPK